MSSKNVIIFKTIRKIKINPRQKFQVNISFGKSKKSIDISFYFLFFNFRDGGN